MARKKLKPLLPSLRERKRYLAYEIISKDSLGMFTDPDAIEQAMTQAVIDYIGYKGLADSGMMVLKDKLDIKKQKGLIRISHKAAGNLRASLMLMDRINNQDVIVRTVGMSGIMKKAYNNFISG